MLTPGLTRRASLLLPMMATALLGACASEPPEDFAPLRYSYLPPIRLDVATIEIQQRFVPSGVPPDVTQLAPVSPSEALRAMAEDSTAGVRRRRAGGVFDRGGFARETWRRYRRGDGGPAGTVRR